MEILQRVARAARMAMHQLRQRCRGVPQPVPGLRFERDIAVTMRDGVPLMANVFRPQQDGRYPVVMSVSPYGKDALPEDYELFRALGMSVGRIYKSDYAAFEAPDPGFWVPRGYVVVHANTRGMWNSEGHASWLSSATPSWSAGRRQNVLDEVNRPHRWSAAAMVGQAGTC